MPSDWGTAVNVQAMVFGNMGEDSGTGVAFTRNPAGRINFMVILNKCSREILLPVLEP